MDHFKTSTANCNNLTKDNLATVLIPEDCLYSSISILKCGSEAFQNFCIY